MVKFICAGLNIICLNKLFANLIRIALRKCRLVSDGRGPEPSEAMRC
jgi:hypothetical protein